MSHTSHIHNMRVEELPQPVDPAPAPTEDRKGRAQALRVWALGLLVLVAVITLATFTHSQSLFGNVSNGMPVTLLLISGLLIHRARELDPNNG